MNKSYYPYAAEFGTGKTLLLVHKATELLKRNEKVLFAVQTDDRDRTYLLLTGLLKRQFGQVLEEHGIRLSRFELTQVGRGGLSKLLADNLNRRHVFVDEALVCQAEKEYLEAIDEAALTKCLWMAFRPDVSERVEGERQLSKVFRNQPNIVRYLKLEQGLHKLADDINPAVTTIIHER